MLIPNGFATDWGRLAASVERVEVNLEPFWTAETVVLAVDALPLNARNAALEAPSRSIVHHYSPSRP